MKMIELTKGFITIIDDDDYEKFGHLNWHYSHGRAVRRTKGANTWLHREIMGDPEGVLVDHINGNPLDNRKSNLRLATKSANTANARKQTSRNTSSRFKGVTYAARNKNKWMAYIGTTRNGTRRNLGSFPTEIEAAEAYNVAAKAEYGVYAKLNVINEPEQEQVCPTCFRPIS